MPKTSFIRRGKILGVVFVTLACIAAFLLIRLSPYHDPGSDPTGAFSVEQSDNAAHYVYVRAEVLSVKSQPRATDGEQTIRAQLLDGPQKGESIKVIRYGIANNTDYKRLPVGSQILLFKDAATNNTYSYVDRYRLPGAATLLIVLIVMIVIIARWRGITSMAGLGISIVVLAAFVIPRIIHGHDAYATCIEGAFIIAVASIYIAHGFSKRTTVAFAGALLTLLLIIGITSLSAYLTGLSGFTGEDSLGITYAKQHISLAGLLFGGIVIASLGVLNDITVGQAAAVDEIHKANKKRTSRELYHSGMSVGREHIAALVNTLALAYVGVALPAVVTTALYNQAPLLVILNSETVMEEIVRSIIVSISLLLAVPVTTALAAYILPRWNKSVDQSVLRWLDKI